MLLKTDHLTFDHLTVTRSGNIWLIPSDIPVDNVHIFLF